MALDILITAGPLKGRRFPIGAGSLRLGRASACEIVIPDPALSRHQCLFEVRDDHTVWLTDLASANGTFVNGTALGAESASVKAGDVVTVGDTTLVLVEEGREAPETPALDLGLGAKTEEADATPSVSPRRFVLWLVAALAVAGAAVLILMGGGGGDAEAAAPVREVKDETPALHMMRFEKVEATRAGIYRYALAFDGATGALAVEIDDVPKENRHVRKSATLSDAARAELEEILAAPELYALDRAYTGVPREAGALTSFALTVARGTRLFATSIENTLEPPAFRAARERLETFSKNELGIWAIQYSTEKLQALSAESRRAGDAKWSERDVQFGNLAAALAAYREAVFYLETVEPKPATYGALVARRDEVAAELEKRYRDQRFLADRAINLGDWAAAQRELRVLCELIPDAKDARHAEAAAKLLDVEARLKKGGLK